MYSSPTIGLALNKNLFKDVKTHLYPTKTKLLNLSLCWLRKELNNKQDVQRNINVEK
jgi:hypothetical protein